MPNVVYANPRRLIQFCIELFKRPMAKQGSKKKGYSRPFPIIRDALDKPFGISNSTSGCRGMSCDFTARWGALLARLRWHSACCMLIGKRKVQPPISDEITIRSGGVGPRQVARETLFSFDRGHVLREGRPLLRSLPAPGQAKAP